MKRKSKIALWGLVILRELLNFEPLCNLMRVLKYSLKEKPLQNSSLALAIWSTFDSQG